ncbi:MAG: LLM class flavin-dependent oxidoreductase [Pseudomonadales bacterium]|nr:LLM class flavin-dependent oxidoreductase [Pseudomonadales bacterium]
MKIGICLPYMKRDITRELLMDWCRKIDQGPFSSLSCGERITDYTFEMRNVLAFAAALTENVRIVPSLYVLPMHSAVWAAKEIATLDQLSNGRVTVTVGVGGRENDYRAVGASFKNRHQKQDEQIAEMRRIWAGEPPFEGADEVGPRPYQDGGPPILAGAMGPKAIARAAHWADGLYGFSMNGSKAETDRMFGMADDAWQEAGRSEAPQKVGGFWYCLADDPENRLKSYVYDYLKVLGDDMAKAVAASMTRHTEDNILRAMDDLEEAGSDEIFMVPATADISEVERLCELIDKRG